MRKIIESKYIHILLIFTFFLFVGYMLPYIADDWFWGSYYGQYHYETGFQYINGRYLGDILIYHLTRNRLLRSFVFSLILTITTYLLSIFKNNNSNKILLSFLLIMTMSFNVLKDGVFWISGFANYVPSALLILIILYIIKLNNKKLTILMLPLGIASSLFLENVTIYHLVFSLILLVYSLIKEKKINYIYLFYFIGSLIGTLIMFLNPSYIAVFSSGDDPFTAKGINFTGMINKIIDEILPGLLYGNPVVITLLSYSIYKKTNKNTFNKYFFITYSLFSFIYALLQLFSIEIPFITILVLLLTLVYLYIYVNFVKKERNESLILYLISIVLLVGPLMIVDPIGYRSIYPIHLLVILSALEIEDTNIAYLYQFVFSMLIIAFLSFIYWRIHDGENKRMHHILNNKNEEKIIIPNLPFNDFIRNEELDVREYQERFSDFYHINKDIKYEIIDYDYWLSNNQ